MEHRPMSSRNDLTSSSVASEYFIPDANSSVPVMVSSSSVSHATMQHAAMAQPPPQYAQQQMSRTASDIIDPSQVLAVALDRAQILPESTQYLSDGNTVQQIQMPLNQLQTVSSAQIISGSQVMQTMDGQLVQAQIIPTSGSQMKGNHMMPVHSVHQTNNRQPTHYYTSNSSNVILGFNNSYPNVKEEEVETEQHYDTEGNDSYHHSNNLNATQCVIQTGGTSNIIHGAPLQSTVETTGMTSQHLMTSNCGSNLAQEVTYSSPLHLQQSTSSGIPLSSNQIVDANTNKYGSVGRYIIQIGKAPEPVQASPAVEVNEDGRLVIRTGSAPDGRLKFTESNVSALRAALSGVKRNEVCAVVSSPAQTSYHIQELSQSKVSDVKGTNRASALPTPPPQQQSPANTRYYECTNCNNKFLRSLCLRAHMKTCRRPELKSADKSPLLMCSFCKSTFKTHPQINHHLSVCPHSPLNHKNEQQPKRARLTLDAVIEQGVQYRCQDCDRTFSKQRQYSSHIKRCTKISVQDLSQHNRHSDSLPSHAAIDEPEPPDDPFADPPSASVVQGAAPSRRGGGRGRRGRRPNKPPPVVAQTLGQFDADTPPPPAVPHHSDQLFDNVTPGAVESFVVADSCGLVRSNTGLSHALQISVEKSSPGCTPKAAITNSEGVVSKATLPDAWSLLCGLCERLFLTKAALAVHVMSTHGPDLRHASATLTAAVTPIPAYRCPVCSLHYTVGDELMEHLVLQHAHQLQSTHASVTSNKNTVVCCVCSLVLATRGLLLEHLALAHLEDLSKLASANTSSHTTVTARVEGSTAAHHQEAKLNYVRANNTKLSNIDHRPPSPTLSPPLSHASSPGTPSQGRLLPTPTPPTSLPASVAPYVGGPLTPSTSNGTPDPSTPDTPYQTVDDTDSENKRVTYMRPYRADDSVLNGPSRNNELECSLCSEVQPSPLHLVEHYAQQHRVERDVDGCLMDLGIGVDVKIKDTSSLVSVSESAALPHKTVLLRPNAPADVRCKECGVLVTDCSLREHMRLRCSSGTCEPYCCTHPTCADTPATFSQVNDIFEHESSSHPERCIDLVKRTFSSLAAFNQWLKSEESSLMLTYEQHTSPVSITGRIHTSLMQFRICQYYATPYQNEGDVSTSVPEEELSQKFIRIRHPNQCFARIQLRIQFNKKSGSHDGETLMHYYPRHSHPTKVQHTHLMGRKRLPYRGLMTTSSSAVSTTADEAVVKRASSSNHITKKNASSSTSAPSDDKLPPPPYSSALTVRVAPTTASSNLASRAPQVMARKMGPFNSNSKKSEAVDVRRQQQQQQRMVVFSSADNSSSVHNTATTAHKMMVSSADGSQRMFVATSNGPQRLLVTAADGSQRILVPSDAGSQRLLMNEAEDGGQRMVLLDNDQRMMMRNDGEVMMVQEECGEQRTVMMNDGTHQRIIMSSGGQQMLLSDDGHHSVLSNGEAMMHHDNGEHRIMMSNGANQRMMVNTEERVLTPSEVHSEMMVDDSGRVIMDSDDGRMMVSDGAMMVHGDDNVMLRGHHSVLSGDAGNSCVNDEDVCEEFVLPADLNEWEKLFDHLELRLQCRGGEDDGVAEFSEEEREEAESLLQLRGVVSSADVAEQVRVFQRVCTLTQAHL